MFFGKLSDETLQPYWIPFCNRCWENTFILDSSHKNREIIIIYKGKPFKSCLKWIVKNIKNVEENWNYNNTKTENRRWAFEINIDIGIQWSKLAITKYPF